MAFPAQLLTPEENMQHIVPTFRRASQDKSWRVRFKVAEHFCKVRQSTCDGRSKKCWRKRGAL